VPFQIRDRAIRLRPTAIQQESSIILKVADSASKPLIHSAESLHRTKFFSRYKTTLLTDDYASPQRCLNRK